jgi:2-methylcitrate dehydratase PrpD
MPETEALASYILNSRPDSVPADVRHEAKRAILNYVGCAIGGSHHPAVDIAIRTFTPYSGKATTKILGRAEQLDPLHAALMNGISSHVYDYDDTTPKNYMHPTSPLASAL